MSSLTEAAVAIGGSHRRFLHLSVDDLDAQRAASIRYVYCSEVEAWTIAEFRGTLSAIVRVLSPGGVLRVVARDLDALIHGYMLDWGSGRDVSRGQQFNLWRDAETAKYLFNEEDLRAELGNAGLVDIWRLPAQASSMAIFQNCEQHAATSLVLEARKSASAL